VQHLTIRNVAPHLARALEEEKRRRGTSMNQTVLSLLEQALGLHTDAEYDNGLAKLAGTWPDAELREFEEAVALFEIVDEDQWQ
jgi:hypothetical protein